MDFNFKKYNTILGWFTFGIALITYTLTLEPTVSFWDAGEYISTAANLEVGHPPGAPLFQMLGAFFAMFATDVTHIAKMVNFMSALSSAFTILFLFWTIVILAKKTLLKENEEISKAKAYAILGSGFVGALTFTFTDSFWFSAVEAEVYAMSMLLTSLLFWLGLRWEAEMDQPKGNKWLLLISLVVGLSFGVHILSLLVIPPIVFIYIYKNYQIKSLKQFILANGAAIIVLLLTFKFLFPFTLRYFSVLELFFVNTIGLPFNSGSIIAAILLLAIFYFAISYTRKKHLVGLNTIVLSLLFMFIGFSSWLMLPIRANANTTINENNPSSARELLAYYNREQYGDANVFYDKYYSYSFRKEEDPSKPYRDDIKKYEKDHKTGKYIVVNKDTYKNYFPNYSDKHKGFIPRMVATSPTNIQHYKAIAGIPENSRQRPTFLQNLKFMFSYQFGYMYGRYFMWNFVGRQNDEQGHLDIHNGNWLSGIPIIDSLFLGPQTDLPNEIKSNKARNTYFFLPLILGLIGVFYHLKKDANYFYILLLFFAFTGLAIIFYTNPKPFEPRERDYAVVGSFYVFAIWVGLGIVGLFSKAKDNLLNKYKYFNFELFGTIALFALFGIMELILNKTGIDPEGFIYLLVSNLSQLFLILGGVAFVLLLIDAITYLVNTISNKEINKALILGGLGIIVPVIMGYQNWDDHDRSNKYTAHLNAQAYLDSCDENAILFTIGDNDTFPLWYLQEIEGYRTDIKVINTSLFATDWYIDQMKRKTYKANPIPSQLTHQDYKYGSLDVAYNMGEIEQFKDSVMDIKLFMQWIQSKKEFTYYRFDEDHREKTYPTNKLRLYVDKEAVLKNGIVTPEDADLIVPYIDFEIDPNGITKQRILMLDILANFDWKQPIYFTGGSYDDGEYIWLKDYLQSEGLSYKLVPIKTPYQGPFETGRINPDVMYKHVKKWDWGSITDNIYLDPETRKNSVNFRNGLNRLANAFAEKGDTAKAVEVIDLSMEKMPAGKFGSPGMLMDFVKAYYKLGEKQKARELEETIITQIQEKLVYFSRFDDSFFPSYYNELENNLLMYGELVRLISNYDDQEYSDAAQTAYIEHLDLFKHLIDE